MNLEYESIAHLIALALPLQCTHQLSTKIIEVSLAAWLLIGLLIERVAVLCLLTMTLLMLHLMVLSLLVDGVSSVLVKLTVTEGMSIILLLGVILMLM